MSKSHKMQLETLLNPAKGPGGMPQRTGKPPGVATGAKERPHKCKICHKRFVSKGDLSKHDKGVHQNQRPYRCDECNQDFTERGNLNKHKLRLHSGRRDHKCMEPGCKVAFATSDSLLRHLRQVHHRPPSRHPRK